MMMCHEVKEAELEKYCDGNWIAEPKFDGSRCLYRYGKMFTIDRFTGKESRDITYKLPELAHTTINAVLDGEIVAESGSFEETGSRIHLQDALLIRISAKKNPVIYWVFDILEIDGKDITGFPLTQRKELLKAITFDNPRFRLVEAVDDIKALWENTKEWQREGIVLKSKTSRYEDKRSWNWLKCKFWKEDVITANSYEENPKGIALMMSNGQRLQCSGGQSVEVKNILDSVGSVRIEIQYLTSDLKVGGKEGEKVYRFPSFKRIAGGKE